MRAALIEDNQVVNIEMLAELKAGYIESEIAGIGDSYIDGVFSRQPELALPLAEVKAQLVQAVDLTIAAIYGRWMRFETEYTAREQAAREYLASGGVGDPGQWVTAFASSTGQSNAQAVGLIIFQADSLRSALEQLGAIRMQKYGITTAETVEAAQQKHDAIIAAAEAIAAGLQ